MQLWTYLTVLIISLCNQCHIPATFSVSTSLVTCSSLTLSLTLQSFQMHLSEKGGFSQLDPKKIADSVADLAESRVFRNLISPMKLPWEKSPVLNPKRAFCQAEPNLGPSQVGMRDFAQDASCRSAPVVAASAPVFTHSLKRAKLASTISSPDELRLRALGLVHIMVESDRTQTKLAMQVGDGPAGPVPIGPSLRDALSGKATATLYKRAYALWGLFAWIKSTTGGTGMEISECNVYAYLCSMREEGRGATSGESVLQALRFFHTALGFVNFNPVTDISARIAGVAKQMFLTKRLLKQARALYVLELKALESAVLEEKQPHIVAIAGYLLFCAMAVCRFSDPMFCQGLQVTRSGQTVLIEAGTSVHKTAHSAEKKTMLLPLMALGSVFRKDKSWAERWYATMDRQFASSRKVYLLPAYSEQSNRWLSRPMTTAEGILWLKDIVQLRCLSGSELTTHSLKTTLLSWVTIFDVMDFQQRRILGHHGDVGLASPLTYGRDNLAPLQLKLHRMLQKIGQGIWDPDLPRVQRLDVDIELAKTCDDLDRDHQGVVYGPHAQQPLDVDELPSPLELDGLVEEVQGSDKVFILAGNADGRLMQHNVSGVLHFVGMEDRFVCGRAISGLYGSIDSDLALQWPVCQQCRRTVGEDVLSSYLDV